MGHPKADVKVMTRMRYTSLKHMVQPLLSRMEDQNWAMQLAAGSACTSPNPLP